MYEKKECLNCQQITKNPKFCSSHCAATFNNKKTKGIPKKEFTGPTCKRCGKRWRNTTGLYYCQECQPYKPNKRKNWQTITIEEHCQDKPNFQAHARIRSLAREEYKKSNKPKLCNNCGYSKFYEVCHIKSVVSFDRSTKISEVNNINNLIGLCPNCHWELDNGFLKVPMSGIEPA